MKSMLREYICILDVYGAIYLDFCNFSNFFVPLIGIRIISET